MAPLSETAADTVRDALALIRAVLDGDDAAFAVVAANVAWPAGTMVVLADWLAENLQVRGVGRDELDAWQSAQGLR